MSGMSSIKTKHIIVRQQQRGLSDELVNLLANFGRESFNQGCLVLDFGKEQIRNLLKEFPMLDKRVLEKLSKCYLIEINGVEITAGYKKRGWGRRCNPSKRRRHTRLHSQSA